MMSPNIICHHGTVLYKKLIVFTLHVTRTRGIFDLAYFQSKARQQFT